MIQQSLYSAPSRKQTQLLSRFQKMVHGFFLPVDSISRVPGSPTLTVHTLPTRVSGKSKSTHASVSDIVGNVQAITIV